MKVDYRKGYYWRIPIYVKSLDGYDEGFEIVGRNWFYNKLIDVALFIDTEILMVDVFKIIVEVDED